MDASLLGALGLGTAADRAAFQAKADARVQDLIATCMAQSGFRYVPYLHTSTDTGTRSPVEPATRAAAQRDGFQLATLAITAVADTSSDPNAAIVKDLTASDQKAYYQALDGEQPDGSTGDGGCRQQAHDNVYGPIDRAMASLDSAVTDMGRRIEADSEYVAINSSWASCMSQDGYAYTSRTDMLQDIEKRYIKLVIVRPAPGSTRAPVAPGGATTAPGAATQPDPHAVAAAAAYERHVAVADVTCYEPLRAREEQLYRRYVLALVANNGSAVDALRAAMSTP